MTLIKIIICTNTVKKVKFKEMFIKCNHLLEANAVALSLVDQPKHFIKVRLSDLHVFASLIDANRLEKRRSKLRT